MNALERLRQWTTVVADTGDFRQLEAYAPRDATTNPTLILKAVRMPEYAGLLDRARDEARKGTGGKGSDNEVEETCDRLLIAFGREILDIIPGRVSTEVDARLA